MLALMAEREQTRGVSRRKARASREQWNIFQLPRRRRVSHAFACKVTQFFRKFFLFSHELPLISHELFINDNYMGHSWEFVLKEDPHQIFPFVSVCQRTREPNAK